MLPTLDEKGCLLFCITWPQLTRRPQSLERGDVVFSQSPINPALLVCKRVFALPGDSMIIELQYPWESKNLIVPRGHVYLLGDNAEASHDSRHYGPVPMSLVQGKVLLQIAPIWKSIEK